MSRWLRIGEARKRLGLSESKTRRLIQSRDLMGRFHSGAWRILRVHVECIAADLMVLEDERMGKSTYRAEYFQQYKARRKELKWPKCEACGFKARKLPDIGCLECYARKQPRREWGRIETEMIEIHAGKDDPANLQLRIYHESGEARTRWAIKTKWSEMGIKILTHQGGYTIPDLMRITGKSNEVFRRLIRDGVITNIGKGSRIIIPVEDGDKVIAQFKTEYPPAYTAVEAAKVLGCTRRGIQSAIVHGIPSWKIGGVRYVCKASIDRALQHLKDTGNLRVQWRTLVN